MLALLCGLQPRMAAAGSSHDFDFATGNWRTRILHQCRGMLARMTVFTASTTAGISCTLRLA